MLTVGTNKKNNMNKSNAIVNKAKTLATELTAKGRRVLVQLLGSVAVVNIAEPSAMHRGRNATAKLNRSSAMKVLREVLTQLKRLAKSGLRKLEFTSLKLGNYELHAAVS